MTVHHLPLRFNINIIQRKNTIRILKKTSINNGLNTVSLVL